VCRWWRITGVRALRENFHTRFIAHTIRQPNRNKKYRHSFVTGKSLKMNFFRFQAFSFANNKILLTLRGKRFKTLSANHFATNDFV
jgi:hypothetical protein